MAAPIRPIEPKPFVGQTVTLPDAVTVVELPTQPFTNTKEIIFLNLSATDNVLVQIAELAVVPSSLEVLFNQSPIIQPGDTLTLDGIVPLPLPLTAVAGTPVAVDEFSVGLKATGALTVNVANVTAGDTITLFPPGGAAQLTANGLDPAQYTLTAVNGPRVAGTLTFQADAGSANAVAASILAAIQDAAANWTITATRVIDRGDTTAPANVVTIFGATEGDYLCPTGATTGTLSLLNTWVLATTTANPGDITVSTPWGNGTNAEIQSDNPRLAQLGITGIAPTDITYSDAQAINGTSSVGWNFLTAVNDPANSFAGTFTAVARNVGSGASITSRRIALLVTGLSGTAGDGLVVSTTAPSPGAVQILTSPTSGGVDAVPAAASVTAANSTVVPAGGAITLAIGSEGNRNPLADSTYWAANPGSLLGIVLKAASGTNVDVNVTMVQNRGYSEGV